VCGWVDVKHYVAKKILKAVITAEIGKINFVSGDLTLFLSDTDKTPVSLRKRNDCQQSGEHG